MNVASLELCKELYELGGWDDTDFDWLIDKIDDYYTRRPAPAYRPSRTSQIFDWTPAYSLGYLLRKLPGVQLNRQSDEEARYGETAWACESGHYGKIADTPEDATAKLAIELFRQGILQKDATL